MAVIPELLLLTGLLTSFYTSKLNSSASVEPSVDDIGGIVGKYENSKSLYDLIAHFPIDEDIKCPESDTRLPYPGDCTRYITCRDFKAHIRGCPPGFRFDKKSLNCRFAFQVKCDNSVEVDLNVRKYEECGLHETLSECEAHCEKTCENYDKPLSCPRFCASGCVCEEGYVRDRSGKCVPVHQCPVRDEVRPVQVPRRCRVNEYFDTCRGHCQKTCYNYNREVPCLPVCTPGCVCKTGYVRGPRGMCIPTQQCPLNISNSPQIQTEPKCQDNEYFDVCKAHCQKDCSNYDRPLICPAICVSGCVCEEGYVRGPDGRCVPAEQCQEQNLSQPSQPSLGFWHYCEGDHVHYERCTALPWCQRNCSNIDKPIPCAVVCAPGCVCDRGYVRGPGWKCIPINECRLQTEPKCEENEYFDVCKAHCQKDCSNYDRPLNCPATCVSGCVCQEGYVRGPDGRCVPVEQCQIPRESLNSRSQFSICPENERFNLCNGLCQKNCSNYDRIPHCPVQCVPGCLCEEGLVRGPQGKCIPIEQCPLLGESQLQQTEASCPINEHYDSCKAHCQKTCSNYNEISLCSEECNPGCVCDSGLVRDSQGKCVPVRQCSQLNKEQSYIPPFDRNCPHREHWEFCTGHCQRNCSNYDKPLVCPEICVEGCLCDRGYTRGPRGDCIPESECQAVLSEQEIQSSSDVCSENEEYSECDANPMCQKTCSNYDKSIFCPKVCIKGCVCKEGYVKSPEGECIPVETCLRQDEQLQDSVESCPENEEHSKCLAGCEKSCLNLTPYCPIICIPGCVCKKGLVRSPFGTCVPVENCPTELPSDSVESCSENEEYSMCEAGCQKSCMNLDPRYCPRVCIPGCVCKEGLVRSPIGTCVPVETCPSELPSVNRRHKCPINKHYSRCGGSILCQETCSSQNKPDSCAVTCVGGCVCDEGLVLGPDGMCIPPSQCPDRKEMDSVQNQYPLPIFCKRDEIFTICASVCPDDCFNYRDTNRPCKSMCSPGCVCKKGFVKSPEGYCINPLQCPMQKKPEDCAQNEYYDSCGTSCPDDCTNYNQMNRQCNQRCVAGCFCQPGFVRGQDGDCIRPFNCPKQQFPYGSQQQQQSPLDWQKKQQSPLDWQKQQQSPLDWQKQQQSALHNQQQQQSPLDSQQQQQSSLNSQQLQQGRTCPDEKACNTFCVNLRHKEGKCIGPQKVFCICT